MFFLIFHCTMSNIEPFKHFRLTIIIILYIIIVIITVHNIILHDIITVIHSWRYITKKFAIIQRMRLNEISYRFRHVKIRKWRKEFRIKHCVWSSIMSTLNKILFVRMLLSRCTFWMVKPFFKWTKNFDFAWT